MAGDGTGNSLLESKRAATRYRILVDVAQRQPAISQQEIADEIGITSQAVSNYLQDLVERGHVVKHRRGRYEITNEGVNWLISRTDDLRGLVEHVTEEVVEEVEVESALATEDVSENERVALEMREGHLHAVPGESGDATAIAVSDASAGREVGVTDIEGVLDHELGTVTVISVPRVRNGGSAALDETVVARQADTVDLVAANGPEAVALARRAGIDVDVRFGTAEAVLEAAQKGLDVLLLVVADHLSRHTDKLREGTVRYEVVDANRQGA